MDDDMGDTLSLISGTVVVIIDACFSGGQFRAIDKIETQPKIRFITKPFELNSFKTDLYKKNPLIERKTDGFALDLIRRTTLRDASNKSDIIILAAADANEESSESHAFRHGEFTYFLLLGLKSFDENNNGRISAEEAFAYASPALKDYNGNVNPQLYDGTSGETDLLAPTADRLVFIGDTNSDGTNVPFNTNWKKQRAEYIYTNAQLGESGFITGLKIFVIEAPSSSLQNCTIRMQHTTRNSYSVSPQWTSSGWTTVYSGTKTINDTGPVPFVFSKLFQYNGNNNLIIDFSFSNPSFDDDPSYFNHSYADNSYPMICFSDDDIYEQPLTWVDSIPQPTRDEHSPYGSYLDLELELNDICIDIPGKITLTSPSGITENTTPIFTWAEDSCATWYKLWVGYPGDIKVFGEWYEASEVCLGGDCSVTLESILLSDTYEWYIKSWNDYGNAWSDGMNFTVQGNDIPPSKITHTSPSGKHLSLISTFTWAADPASTWYRLWVGYPGDIKVFAQWYDAADICSGGNCSVTTGTEFNGGNYEWYIKSWNDYGKVWSDGMSFSVGE